MQYFIVICCILLAVGYAAWRIMQSVQQPVDPCAGCEGCALKDINNKKQTCDKKKQWEKFGRTGKKH